MKNGWIIACLAVLIGSCQTEYPKGMEKKAKKETAECAESCCPEKRNDSTVIACKLTSPELQRRKATVLAGLRKQVKRKSALTNGYKFTFNGSDEMLDELTEFIKTERQCCDFFTFSLSVNGDQSETVLSVTGPEGAKEFITSELEL